jgi:outer membrane protein assembly factor BamB
MKGKMIEIIVCMLLIASAILPAQGIIPQNTHQTTTETQPITDETEWWPMFQHDIQLTGYTPGASPDTNKKLWEQHIDPDIWFSSPAILDDNLFIGTGERYDKTPKNLAEAKHFYDTTILMKDKTFNDILQQSNHPRSTEIGKLYRLNAKTGEILWEFEANGSIFASPTVDNNHVYIVSADSNNYAGRLYCIQIDNGQEVWSIPVLTGYTTPTLSNGKLYLLTFNTDDYNGSLQCFNAADGSELWNHTTGYIDFSLYTAPALADGNVFFTSIDSTDGIKCKITCLNQSTGQFLWDTRMSEMNFGYALSSPVITNHKAYVISADTLGFDQFWCVLTCFDTSDGSILWNYTMKENTTDELSFSSPTVSYGNVYVALMGSEWTYGKIMCLNADNGTIQWVHKSNDAYTLSSPIISDGKVFIGGLNMSLYEGNLYCFDAFTGDLLYTAFVDNDFIDSTPAIADETVYIAAVMGTTCAFQDSFKLRDIKGGLATVKFDIENVGGYDIQNIRYSMNVTGGIFEKINTQVNNTIEVLEAQTSDTIKAAPIIGFGKIQITITVEMEAVTPIVKTAEGIVLGIFVIIR